MIFVTLSPNHCFYTTSFNTLNILANFGVIESVAFYEGLLDLLNMLISYELLLNCWKVHTVFILRVTALSLDYVLIFNGRFLFRSFLYFRKLLFSLLLSHLLGFIEVSLGALPLALETCHHTKHALIWTLHFLEVFAKHRLSKPVLLWLIWEKVALTTHEFLGPAS